MEEKEEKEERMKFNKYQTAITDEIIEKYPKEVIDELFEYINSVPFIQRLVSPDRKYARDLPRDENGKIIVDLSRPHILEDMDYFRQAAIHFQEHGVYTKLKVNTNPMSPYMQWLKEEIRRCWHGMVRESDGEWITGDFYFYLNYFPIKVSKITGKSKVAVRTVDCPEMWEGVYWRFHYWDQARNGGLYDPDGGKHAFEIASRGKSKSFSMAAQLSRDFSLGTDVEDTSNKTALVLAEKDTYLTDDGTLNKFHDGFTFLKEHTQFPSAIIKENWSDLMWQCGWKDPEGNTRGNLNVVSALAIAGDPQKPRGKRASRIYLEEYASFAKLKETMAICIANMKDGATWFGNFIGVACVCKGTKVWDAKGNLVNIEDLRKEDGIMGFKGGESYADSIESLYPPSYKDCVKITFKSGRTLSCSKDHPILVNKNAFRTRIGERRLNKFLTINKFIEAGKLDNTYLGVLPGSISKFSSEVLEHARLIGWLVGDGSYGKDKTPILSNCESEINDYIHTHYDVVTERGYITKLGKTYEENRIKNICPILRKCGIYGQTKSNKRLPVNIHNYSKESICEFIGGLYDTDGYISTNKNLGISISQSHKEILEELQLLLLKIGVNSFINYKESREGMKGKNGWYTLDFKGKNSIINFHDNVKLFPKFKQEALDFQYNEVLKKNSKLPKTEYHDKIVSIEDIGSQLVYNMTTKDTHTYIANGIVTHNTGGTEGASFEGALEMIYYPVGYDIYPLPNVYDKGSTGSKETLFFFPAFVNYKPYYNKDGVSDIIAAMLHELKERYLLKYNSSDIMALTSRKAEFAFTIQDAIMKRDGTIFPVADLNDRINQIDNDTSVLKEMYIGRLELDGGEVKWKPDSDLKPILQFPHKDNKLKGCVYIRTMPIKDSNGVIPWGRYIFGCDPVDTDLANTLSLFSMYVLDLWTDTIVAEYTGREDFVDDSFEIARRLALFYNAEGNYEKQKKGLFTQFSKHNCLHLLSGDLEFLRDMSSSKPELIGNNAKGTNASKEVKSYARRFIRDYLLKPDIDIILHDGEEITISKPKLFSIPYRALLQELAMWSDDLNTDRVDALGMLMLLREDKLRLLGDTSFETRHNTNSSDYLGNDQFFEVNYGKQTSEDKFYKQLEKLGYTYTKK